MISNLLYKEVRKVDCRNTAASNAGCSSNVCNANKSNAPSREITIGITFETVNCLSACKMSVAFEKYKQRSQILVSSFKSV